MNIGLNVDQLSPDKSCIWRTLLIPGNLFFTTLN